jgi:hypothetical protein
MTTKPQQIALPGIPAPTPPDERSIDLDALIDTAVGHRRDARDHNEKARDAFDIVLAKMVELGYERYAFEDPHTGKRRHLVRDVTPRAKVQAAPRRTDLFDDEAAEDAGYMVEPDAPADDGKVESRRVSRASVADEIDPFAKLRGRMDADGGVQ